MHLLYGLMCELCGFGVVVGRGEKTMYNEEAEVYIHFGNGFRLLFRRRGGVDIHGLFGGRLRKP